MRILNEFDLWSEWGTVTTTIQNEMNEKLQLTVTVQNYGVAMSWNLSGVMAYLFRDGQLIDKTTGTAYIDYESIGTHQYAVLVGNSAGSYVQSDTVSVTVTVPAAVLGKRRSGDWILLEKRRGSFPVHKINANTKTSYQFYAGRRLPVAYSPDNLTRTHTFEFSTKSRETAERVAALTGEEVVYKDRRGDLAVGVIDKVTQQTDTDTDLNFQITEVSKGEVTYD